MSASTGSIATNFHEGSRSEYLAQYVFASFGTAVAVSHQEDAGIDLYCTLTESVGRLAWPRQHYTVQVKSSGARPRTGRRRGAGGRSRRANVWEFTGPESVRWLLEHPLPLFLCVIDKKEARLTVFKTYVRLASGFPERLPAMVRLHPGTPTRTRDLGQTPGVWNLALREPILSATLVDLLDDDTRLLWQRVLGDWAAIDEEAIARWRRGVKAVKEPQYQTNERPTWDTSSTTSAGLGRDAVPGLLAVLEEFSGAYQDEFSSEALLTETLICMLHRQLNGVARVAERGDRMMFSHIKVNKLLKEEQVFGGAERLIETVRRVVTGAAPAARSRARRRPR